MKNLLLVAFDVIFLLSCNKEIAPTNGEPGYLNKVKAGLKDSLTAVNYANLDFERSVMTKTDKGHTFFRVPLINKKFSEEFVLLDTDTSGGILKGLIIQLHQEEAEGETKYQFNGTVRILHLNRTVNVISDISNGYVAAFHRKNLAHRFLVVPQAKEYPEIIVDYYYLLSNGGMPTTYINSSGFFGQNSGGRTVEYSSIDGSSNEGDNSSRSNSENEDKGNDLLVDFEFVEDLSPIDITRYLKCFSTIPDVGATCSIAILVDIPVDNHPNTLFNVDQNSPGHTFLQITKTNGNQTITQNIGFYPNGIWKMLLYEPVQSKIVDNGEHEYNASLQMTISPDQLNSTLDYLNNIANRNYDIDDYNCTDFALEVFNQSRAANPIEIQKMLIPGGVSLNTSTPGALYNELSIMQASGVESANINLPHTKAFVSASTGPCN